MKRITIIGTGYVGLVSGVCLAQKGNKVICYDIDASKIRKLKQGKIPFYEPDLDKLLLQNLKSGRLQFANSLERALQGAQFVFICVGTPPKKNGSADLRAYFNVIKKISAFLKRSFAAAQDDVLSAQDDVLIIINKSTVPVGTSAKAARQLLKKVSANKFAIVSNPEFLREGVAVKDFMRPDRIVIGADQRSKIKNQILDLYKPFPCPKLITNWETAEMIKYASNAYLATKISFINEIASVCDKVGADVKKVAQGMGHDPRIGNQFLRAGIGYGGSCFPKDVRALRNISKIKNYNFKLLKSVIEVNNQQRTDAVKKITKALGKPIKNKQVAVLGLSFKPDTDDTRESASIFIIKELLKKGIKINAFDPAAIKNARKDLKGRGSVSFSQDALSSIKGVDLVFLATEWPEFVSLNWKKVKQQMRGSIIIDGRNALAPDKLEKIGFKYIGFGI